MQIEKDLQGLFATLFKSSHMTILKEVSLSKTTFCIHGISFMVHKMLQISKEVLSKGLSPELKLYIPCLKKTIHSFVSSKILDCYWSKMEGGILPTSVGFTAVTSFQAGNNTSLFCFVPIPRRGHYVVFRYRRNLGKSKCKDIMVNITMNCYSTEISTLNLHFEHTRTLFIPTVYDALIVKKHTCLAMLRTTLIFRFYIQQIRDKLKNFWYILKWTHVGTKFGVNVVMCLVQVLIWNIYKKFFASCIYSKQKFIAFGDIKYLQ